MWATSHDDSTLVSYCDAALTALGGSTSITFSDGCASTKVRGWARSRDFVLIVSKHDLDYVTRTLVYQEVRVTRSIAIYIWFYSFRAQID